MFKKPTKRNKNVRKRKVSTEQDEGLDETENVIEMAKLRRELTKKTAGVSAIALAKGVKVTKQEELDDDPFKMRNGGLTIVKTEF